METFINIFLLRFLWHQKNAHFSSSERVRKRSWNSPAQLLSLDVVEYRFFLSFFFFFLLDFLLWLLLLLLWCRCCNREREREIWWDQLLMGDNEKRLRSMSGNFLMAGLEIIRRCYFFFVINEGHWRIVFQGVLDFFYIPVFVGFFFCSSSFKIPPN